MVKLVKKMMIEGFWVGKNWLKIQVPSYWFFLLKPGSQGCGSPLIFCISGSSCFSQCGFGSSFIQNCSSATFKLRKKILFEEFAVNDPHQMAIGFLIPLNFFKNYNY